MIYMVMYCTTYIVAYTNIYIADDEIQADTGIRNVPGHLHHQHGHHQVPQSVPNVPQYCSNRGGGGGHVQDHVSAHGVHGHYSAGGQVPQSVPNVPRLLHYDSMEEGPTAGIKSSECMGTQGHQVPQSVPNVPQYCSVELEDEFHELTLKSKN